MTPLNDLFNSNSKQALRRLTALWAFTEAGLGGILHAIEFPFIGLIIGSIAMVIILFIFRFSNGKLTILLKALLLVLIVKITVSPHSGPTAYFAVCFQALSGYLIFKYLKVNKISIALFFILGLFQSAFQKLINLTIIYGNDFWISLENFSGWVLKQIGVQQESEFVYYALTGYIAIHFLMGLLFSFLTVHLLNRFAKDEYLESRMSNVLPHDQRPLKRNGLRKKMVWLLLLTLIFVAGTTYFFSESENAWRSVLFVTVRTILILVLWFGVLGPLILHWIRKYLENKKSKYQEELEQIFKLLPYYPSVVKFAAKEAKKKPFVKKPTEFFYHLFRESLLFEIKRE